MEKSTHPLATVAKCALILCVYIASFLLWKNQYSFTQHKWHEGCSDKVIYDVIENYAAPGESVTDVISSLGEGKQVPEETRDAYLTLCGFTPDTHDVLIYTVKTKSSTNTARSLIVIHDNTTVQKTMLVNSLS